MKNSKSTLWAVVTQLCFKLLSLSVLVPSLQAQESIAYVSPDVPNDPNLAKVTMFRLWYVGSPSAPSIALVRETKGQAPIYLEGKLQAGLYSPYVPLKSGDFSMHIIDGNVPAPKDASEKIPLEEKKLVDPVDARFRPGTYLTLLVEEKDGRYKARFIEDKRPPASSPPVMDVKDFSGLNDWTIRLLDRNMNLKQTLWSSANGLPTSPIPLPGEGIYRIQVSRPVAGASWQLGLFEAKLSAGSAFSIILHGGGHGDHGTCGLSFDGVPSPYSAEQIQAVVGNSH